MGVELETKLQNYIFSPKEEGSKQVIMLAGSAVVNKGWRRFHNHGDGPY